MASIEEDLTELDELVGELLLYLRCGDEAAPLAIESFDARVELEELLERLGESRPEIRVQLEAVETASGESSSVAAERRYFRRAMQNLISNALKYARSEVSLRVEGSPEVTLIAVEDDGPGVPEDQRQRIFEPFARVDDSRSRESGGVGLGLAIVKRIVELHQGSVRVESSEHGGARFVVGWPRRGLASTRGDT